MLLMLNTELYRIVMTKSPLKSSPDRPPRGRPRSLRAHDAALAAAFALLVERGYDGLSLEAVAARAGTGKATLYRHWPDKAALVVEAFFAATAADLDFAGHTDPRDDFRDQIHRLAALLRSPAGRAFTALMAGAARDPALAEAVATRWLAARQRAGIARFEAARAAGQVQDGTDTGAALGLFYAPLYTPLFLGVGIPDESALNRSLNLAFRAVFA